MITTRDIQTVNDGDVYDNDGDKVGSVGQVYLDNQTGNPEWVTVKTGLFGTKSSFVPLAQATVQGEDLHVPFGKDQIKDAPKIDDEQELTPGEEQELYRYYGVGAGTAQQGDERTAGAPVAAPVVGGGEHRAEDADRSRDREDISDRADVQGQDVSGPTTDRAMTRSEEQLEVGTERVQTGTARLRKYIVTEQETHTVPVSHEEVTLTREPITDANRDDALSGRELSEEEHEVTLHAERATVDKTVAPVERIALGTETKTGEQTVTEDVRKERVELADDSDTGRGLGTDRDADRS